MIPTITTHRGQLTDSNGIQMLMITTKISNKDQQYNYFTGSKNFLRNHQKGKYQGSAGNNGLGGR